MRAATISALLFIAGCIISFDMGRKYERENPRGVTKMDTLQVNVIILNDKIFKK